MPKQARGVRQPDPTTEELLLVRRLKREGKDLTAVHKALGWKITERSTQEKLAQYGVRLSRSSTRRAHLGNTTTYPEREKDGQAQKAEGR